ncbi:hypothetical protein C3920_15510 [Novacetimonas pomaceti]|uniref:Uncharacterized protein n=1 Tax=Novacetimonas pomaceti TaxID=2021998 RepID=A0ABX5P372_9PROT|nr:hypothetical protein C3920_15510 [Novacetimonas pomaceti]
MNAAIKTICGLVLDIGFTHSIQRSGMWAVFAFLRREGWHDICNPTQLNFMLRQGIQKIMAACICQHFKSKQAPPTLS